MSSMSTMPWEWYVRATVVRADGPRCLIWQSWGERSGGKVLIFSAGGGGGESNCPDAPEERRCLGQEWTQCRLVWMPAGLSARSRPARPRGGPGTEFCVDIVV